MADQITSTTSIGKRGAYITLDSSDKVLSTDSVTAAMWSGNNPTLRTFLSSSAQVTSAVKEYYTSVFQTASTGITAAIQFDIAYANSKGSGSVPLNPLVVGTTPTRINYGSYRNLTSGKTQPYDPEAGVQPSTVLTISVATTPAEPDIIL